jgi:hypothetical protein
VAELKITYGPVLTNGIGIATANVDVAKCFRAVADRFFDEETND